MADTKRVARESFYSRALLMCALFSLLIFAAFTISAYAEDNQDGEAVLVAENATEFSIEAAQIASDNLEDDETLEASVRRRILAICSSQPDFSDYDGITDVVSDGDELYIIQCDSEENAEKAFRRLEDSEHVISVEFDEVVSGTALSEGYKKMGNNHLSWGANAIGVDNYAARTEDYRNNTITVAVIDTGVDERHMFIKQRLINGYDFIDNDSKANDREGHGTHVAGIITDCTTAVDEISIMPVRVLDENGEGANSVVAAGVMYAAENGASVLNMSLGGSHSGALDYAIKKAMDRGAIIVAASGNEGANIDYSGSCPAHIVDVITVGAINSRFWAETYSNYGEKLDVVAPGTAVYSSYLNNSYESLSGTSMATPHVSACVALMEMRYGKLSLPQVESLIKRSCDVYRDKMHYGNGVINLNNLAANIVDQNTKVSKTTFTYTGKAIKPGVALSRNNESLFNNSDYTVEYINNVKVGKGTIVINGKGSYYGKNVIYFNINPKGTSVSKVTPAKKQIKLKWKKQATQTSGYQIQYALNKKFSSAKSKTVSNNKSTGVTLKKLKSRKTYYVRVRTYKTVSGKKYYSNWSAVKSVRTK